jgi:hypothetical protein
MFARVAGFLRKRSAHDDAMDTALEITASLVAHVLGDERAVEVRKRVRLFSVHGVVANLAGGVGHAERDAQDVLDEDHDEGRPDDVPANDEECADDLEPDLLAVAVNSALQNGKISIKSSRGTVGSETYLQGL